MLKLRSEALAMPAEPRATRRGRRPAIAAACAALLAIAGVAFVVQGNGRRQSPKLSEFDTYSTSIGERRSVRTRDGSRIVLSTNSAVQIAIGLDGRDVRLLRGEAWFDVAKDPSRPFTVTAGDRVITALGTSFDVHLDDNSVSVLLAEGKVAVAPRRPVGIGRLFPGIEREILREGERLIARRGRAPEVTSDDVAQAGSWREGLLIFREQPLSLAVDQMNRFSVEQVVIDDARIAALPISGVFSTDRPADFVAAVTMFYSLRAENSSRGLIRLGWADATAANRERVNRKN